MWLEILRVDEITREECQEYVVVWEHQPRRSRPQEMVQAPETESPERARRAGHSGLGPFRKGGLTNVAAAAEVVESKGKKHTGCSDWGQATHQNRGGKGASSSEGEAIQFLGRGGVRFQIMFNRQLEFKVGEPKEQVRLEVQI